MAADGGACVEVIQGPVAPREVPEATSLQPCGMPETSSHDACAKHSLCERATCAADDNAIGACDCDNAGASVSPQDPDRAAGTPKGTMLSVPSLAHSAPAPACALDRGARSCADPPSSPDALHATGVDQASQDDEVRLLRAEVESMREDLNVLRECLFTAGVLRSSDLVAKSRALRVAGERAALLDAALRADEIAVSVGLFAGLAAIRAAGMTSRTLRGAAGSSWRAVSAVCPTHVYVCGGRAEGGQILDSVDRFCPSTGAWEELPPMSRRRVGASAGVLLGRLYICGGFSEDGQAVNSLERFDPGSGCWENLPPMSISREATSAGVIGGRLYVCGGFNSDRQPLGYAERFNPVDAAWEALPPMLGRRGGAAAGAVGGRLYVCGGRDREGPLNSAECFDSTAYAWRALPAMGSRRVAAAATAAARHLFVLGGWSGNWQAQSTSEVYDTEVGAWSSLDAMSSPRSGAAAVACGGLVYVFGGHNGSQYLSTVEQFDIRSSSWTSLAPLKERRLFVTAAVMEL